MDDDGILPLPLGTVKLRFGFNGLSGVAELPRRIWTHVFRLTIDRSPWDRTIGRYLLRLPTPIQSIVKKFWPAYFLPDKVIIKKLKPGKEEDFENEKKWYGKLKALQGSTIPTFYGEARIDGTRALVLSEVDGVLAVDQPKGHPLIDRHEFERRVLAALRELEASGAYFSDENVWNVFLVDDRVTLVDLEGVCDVSEVRDMDHALKMDAADFALRYQRHLNKRVER